MRRKTVLYVYMYLLYSVNTAETTEPSPCTYVCVCVCVCVCVYTLLHVYLSYMQCNFIVENRQLNDVGVGCLQCSEG